MSKLKAPAAAPKVGLRTLIASTPAAGENVSANGVDTFIRPVTIAEVLTLSGEFPALKSLFFSTLDGVEFTEKDLLGVVMDDGAAAAAALITLAAGEGRDRDVRAAVIQLPDDTFAALMAATIRQMMPKGIQDFFDRAARYVNVMTGRSDEATAA